MNETPGCCCIIAVSPLLLVCVSYQCFNAVTPMTGRIFCAARVSSGLFQPSSIAPPVCSMVEVLTGHPIAISPEGLLSILMACVFFSCFVPCTPGGAPVVLAQLDKLVEPLEKTLTAKLKSDAVKQEVRHCV